jgi:hypothetical protein
MLDFPRLRKTAKLSFGKDEFLSGPYLKDTAGALDEPDLLNAVRECALEFLRQTGGSSLIPSRIAVFDAHVQPVSHLTHLPDD